MSDTNLIKKSPKRMSLLTDSDNIYRDTRVSPKNDSQIDIPMKEYFNFMRRAYQLQEATQGGEEGVPEIVKIDWDELEKDPVVKTMIETCMKKCDDPLAARRGSEGGAGLELLEYPTTSNTTLTDDHAVGKNRKEQRRNSLCVYPKKTTSIKSHNNIDLEENCVESILLSKLNDVLNQGMLDSVLSYIVSYSKMSKEKNAQQSIIKKPTGTSSGDLKKTASFSGFVSERESKEKLGIPSRDKFGRRKSSTADKIVKPESEVEIHVCDEVKGLKRDFRCPQHLLISKMGYFADVTSGQKLEDMDISVHCDIQIFDWLMRWVKKDTIMVADWPVLEPNNVIPILVSASFLQMDPLVHDCLIYCHGHMNEIVKTHTNLGCLNDAILTRLGAMYTNSELEAIKDKKDKILSRLYCKMILSLGEPVPETLRGHYSSLSTMYRCSSCSKLISKQTADRIQCQSSNMSFDKRGNIISAHTRDQNWNINDHIMTLHNEIMSWRKVYWRLWGECHTLRCNTCDNHFSVNQMEWCCYHPDMPQFFSPDPAKPMCLPIGRYPCCSQRAYRFQILNQQQSGCQFREHTPDQKSGYEVSVLSIYNNFKHVIATPPPKLVYPERIIRLVTRDINDTTGKLNCQEIFWWEGMKLAPSRQPLGLLGKLYSGNVKTHGNKQYGNTSATIATTSASFVNSLSPKPTATNEAINSDGAVKASTENVSVKNTNAVVNKFDSGNEESSDSSSESASSSTTSDSSSSEDSSHSEENTSHRVMTARRMLRKKKPKVLTRRRCGASGGRMWAAALSARSNQDHQRQYEERTGRQMRALLSKRVSGQVAMNQDQPIGGVYVRLEAEWKESITSMNPKSRPTHSARGFKLRTVKK